MEHPGIEAHSATTPKTQKHNQTEIKNASAVDRWIQANRAEGYQRTKVDTSSCTVGTLRKPARFHSSRFHASSEGASERSTGSLASTGTIVVSVLCSARAISATSSFFVTTFAGRKCCSPGWNALSSMIPAQRRPNTSVVTPSHLRLT